MRSPVKLVCERPFLDIGDKDKICRWSCVDEDRVQGARFVDRRSKNGLEHILHRSTKFGSKWQLTWLDKDGPGGDTQGSSCDVLLKRAHLNENHKLVEIYERKLSPGEQARKRDWG